MRIIFTRLIVTRGCIEITKKLDDLNDEESLIVTRGCIEILPCQDYKVFSQTFNSNKGLY